MDNNSGKEREGNLYHSTSSMGIFGAVKLGLAVYKAQELPLAVAGLATTGGGAPAAAVLAAFTTASIFGQGLTGMAQLYSAGSR
jgi:hypothetical protein